MLILKSDGVLDGGLEVSFEGWKIMMRSRIQKSPMEISVPNIEPRALPWMFSAFVRGLHLTGTSQLLSQLCQWEDCTSGNFESIKVMPIRSEDYSQLLALEIPHTPYICIVDLPCFIFHDCLSPIHWYWHDASDLIFVVCSLHSSSLIRLWPMVNFISWSVSFGIISWSSGSQVLFGISSFRLLGPSPHLLMAELTC